MAITINTTLTDFQLKRDTEANFISNNPVLLDGEPAYSTDVNNLKIGDGVSTWTNLNYISSGGGLTQEQIEDFLGTSTIVGGTNITSTYDDGAGTITLSVDNTNLDAATVNGLTVETAVPVGAVFTDTTYSIGNGGLTEINFTSSDKTKLDGIEVGATADLTASEIKVLYESNLDTNAFTDALSTKLLNIETNATADQTGAEIEGLLDTELANVRWKEVEVPAGGTTGQVLKKNSNLDYDYSWQADENSGGGSGITPGTKGDINVVGADTDWQIVAGAVGTNEIADLAVTNSKIANFAVDGIKISPGAIDQTKIADNEVINAKLANMAANTIKGRITASTGDPENLTAAQVRTIINVEDGAAADQTAAEVPVVLTPSNYSASSADVEAHLVGIDTALGAAAGGITAENQRKIDNARDFFIQYHTASVVTIDSVASYITYQTANDENKKIINSVEATNNVDYLLTNVGSIGQTVIVDNDGSGTVRLIADDTETFIGEGNTGENFSASENAATIPQYSRVIATKKKANLWRVDGVYSTSTVDVSAPTVTSSTVENANPNQLVVVFNKAVNAANVAGLSLDGSWTGITVSSIVSGNGTSTVTFGLSASIASGESGNFVYSASNTITSVDFGKQLAAGSTAVTNNVSSGTELHTDSNAASPAGVTEANTTTGWTAVNGPTFTSSTENVDFGTYSFKIVAASGAANYVYKNFPVTAGKTYELKMRANQTVGTSGIIHSPNDSTLGSDTISFRPISEGVWADHNYTFTCSTTGSLEIRIYVTNGGNAGDVVFADNISFKELP